MLNELQRNVTHFVAKVPHIWEGGIKRGNAHWPFSLNADTRVIGNRGGKKRRRGTWEWGK